MKKRDLVKIIKEVIKEDLLKEINIKPEEPKEYEYFNLSNDEKQYGFQTKKGNKYRFFLKKTCLYINDEEIIKIYTEKLQAKKNKKENNKKCYDFVMLSFNTYEDNPNDNSSFEKQTAKDEPIQIMKYILWLLLDYINKNEHEDFFAFSAESKRMSLYSNVFNEISNSFDIFSKKKAAGYNDEMVFIIKK